MKAPRYFLHSYGCQMNKLDSELVESRLVEAGYQLASSEDDADVILLNTCAVRQHAEDKVWSRLGRLRIRKRKDPGMVVGVLGCMAQEHKRYLQARMPHVDLVVGPSAFGDIDTKVTAARERNQKLLDEAGKDQADKGAGIVSVDHGVSGDSIHRNVRVRPHQSQAFVSIMRGCNMPCTYCIVPTTRGIEISRPMHEIVEEAQRLVDDGVTEVTLLGQTINAYGRDLGRDKTFSRLLRELHEIPALRRLAFITSHPNFLSKDLISTIAELPRVARFLHLPAQSGSDLVLKNMRRGYTRERYVKRIEQLWAEVPEMELHSDWIVGYPGETDAELQKTVDLMEELRFAQSYVFKYSPRPGTLAADDLEDDVPDAVKVERNRILLEVQERHTREKNEALVGSIQEVLVEGQSKVAGRMTGRSVQHRLVHFEANDESLVGQYLQIKVDEALAHSLVGKVVEIESEAKV